MTEDDLCWLSANDASSVIAKLPDDEARKLSVAYLRKRSTFSPNIFLQLVEKAKGAPPVYASLVFADLESDKLVNGEQELAAQASSSGAGYLARATAPKSDTAGWEIILIVVGVMLTIFSFFFDVSVSGGVSNNFGIDLPSRVANINLIGLREMICMCGNALFLAGCILLAGRRSRGV